MRRVIAVCVALAAVTLAVFWPVFQNGFVNYDDPSYVTENLHVLKGVNFADAEWAFQTDHAGNWHPLTWLSHMLDVNLFGTKAAGHHLTSLLFHIANTVLLFLLFRNMTGAVWRSAFVAALFALHPLHVESVAWVAERKDVLSTFFLLLSLLGYAGYVRRTGTPAKSRATLGCYALSLLFFACGLMSKPMLVTLPFVLLLLDFWPLGRLRVAPLGTQFGVVKKLIWEKVPFFALSAVSCVVTYVIQSGAGATNSLQVVPVELRLSNVLISYVRYAVKMFWPGGLAVLYPLPREWPVDLAIGAALVLLGATGAVLWNARRAPWLAMGWFWYLGTLVPVVGFVQVGQQAMADRYSYIPLIGLFVMIVWSLAEIPARWPAARPWLAVGGLAVVAGCGVDTWRQLAFWRDSRVLFEHALAVTRDNSVAQNNLGVVLNKLGKTDDAERHFEESVRIHPGYPEALANLAVFRDAEGRTEEAVELLKRSLQSRPNTVAAYDLANILTKQGKLAEAEEHYREALKIDPEFADAWFNLGILHGKQGRSEEANQDYATALRLKPDNAQAHLTLGASLAGQHMYDQAIAEFNAVLRADTNNTDAHFNLGFVLQSTGDLGGAAFHFGEVCRLHPDDVEARRNLGFALLCQGKMAEAAPQFEQVLRAGPDAKAEYYLALSFDGQGQARPAAAHYREAVRLAPTTALYLNDLAWLLATSADDSVRNGAEAVVAAQEATRLNAPEPRFWGTLDAAYAEAGRFEEAIATAAKTRELAQAAKQSQVAQAADERLALYRMNKPYRQAAR